MRIAALCITNRSSPVVVDCTVFCRVADGKSSLHLGLVYFRQAESQVVEQDLLMLSRCREAAFADVNSAAGWQHDVDHLQAAQLRENATRFVAESRLLTHLAQCFPEDVRQETDEDVSQNPLLFLVPDRADLEVAFVDAERGFRFGQLNVRLPQLLISPVGDVGSQ